MAYRFLYGRREYCSFSFRRWMQVWFEAAGINVTLVTLFVFAPLFGIPVRLPEYVEALKRFLRNEGAQEVSSVRRNTAFDPNHGRIS